MNGTIEQWTMTASVALILCAPAGCKKKTDAPAPEASVAAASAAVASAPTLIAPLIQSAVPAAAASGTLLAAPVLGDVKRYPEKEKPATGAVKVALDDSKVYDEPDNTKPVVATLSKDLFVVRLARLEAGWILVDFPSGVGKLSPGWIEAKSVGASAQPTVTKAAVAAQPSAKAASATAPTASVAPVASAAPVVATATAAAAPVVVRKPGAILARPH